MLVSLLTACFLAALSAVALGWMPRSEGVLVAIAGLSSVASVATLPRRPLVWFLTVLVAATCWGALLSPRPERVDLADLRGGLARLELLVGRGGCSDRGCYSEAELLACRELEPHACVPAGSLLGVSSERELPLGATVSALGKLSPRVTFHNPSEVTVWPDTRPELRATLKPGSQPRIDRLSWLDGLLSRARHSLRRALEGSLHPPHTGIARALLLGEGAAVERTLNDAIRGAGVSHVLAVSGMHVTLLVGALVLLARWLWLRTPLALYWEARRVSAGLGVVLAPLIARLCGASPSAVRAAYTSALMYLVTALGLRPSALAVSAVVVSAHAVLTPRDALHPGFVLSVLATAALLTHPRPARLGQSATPAHGPVGAALRESLRAWLATTPFLLLCFGQTSLVSLLANVALIPIGTALVPLAAVHAGVVQLALHALIPSAPLFELVSAAFVEAARICAGVDPGLSLPPLTGWQLMALVVVASSLMLDLSWRTRGMVAAGALSVFLLSEWSLRRSLAASDLRVTFLDVSQGDAALLETAGHAALIDAGGSIGGGPDPGALAVLPLLRARRITHLDWVVLSHPHPDHYGGLRAVLDNVSVGELWDTGQAEAEATDPDSPVAQLLSSAQERGARVRAPTALCDREHALGSARVRVLAPCPTFDLGRGPNDNSFVLRVAHGARSFLFTGDIEHEAEAELTRAPSALRSDVFKVPHHGSRTSSSEALLRAVAPTIAVVSAGRANRFGHPHPEVETRLAQHAKQVLRTDQAGGVQVVSDGKDLTVTTALPRANSDGFVFFPSALSEQHNATKP